MEENTRPLPTHEEQVRENKQIRKDADEIIQRIKNLPRSTERTIAMQKLQEGVMWMGLDLKRMGEANPYPESKNPDSQKIEPTADGLKL